MEENKDNNSSIEGLKNDSFDNESFNQLLKESEEVFVKRLKVNDTFTVIMFVAIILFLSLSIPPLALYDVVDPVVKVTMLSIAGVFGALAFVMKALRNRLNETEQLFESKLQELYKNAGFD